MLLVSATDEAPVLLVRHKCCWCVLLVCATDEAPVLLVRHKCCWCVLLVSATDEAPVAASAAGKTQKLLVCAAGVCY
jgi:hypothetical protein